MLAIEKKLIHAAKRMATRNMGISQSSTGSRTPLRENKKRVVVIKSEADGNPRDEGTTGSPNISAELVSIYGDDEVSNYFARLSMAETDNDDSIIGSDIHHKTKVDKSIVSTDHKFAKKQSMLDDTSVTTDTTVGSHVSVCNSSSAHSSSSSISHILGKRSAFTAITSLPLPRSNLPEPRQLYGRENEIKTLFQILLEGGCMVALVGAGGMGKSHCASHFCRKWVQKEPLRFVMWLNAASEMSLRVSYLEALEQILHLKENPGEDPVSTARRLRQQKLRQNDDDCSMIARNDDAHKDEDDTEDLRTGTLAKLLWDTLLEQISPSFEWIAVFQNLRGGMGGVEGPEGIQPYFFPNTMFPNTWKRGRIIFTTRDDSILGENCLGNITALPIIRLGESAAVRMFLANAVVSSCGTVTNLGASQERVLKESEQAAKKLVGPDFFDGSPLMIATAIGHIVSMQITLRQYYESLKQEVARSTSNCKSNSSALSAKAVELALSNAMHHAATIGLTHTMACAAFIASERIPLKLLVGDEECVNRLCALNLLSHVTDGEYSMHRLHQRAAREATVTADMTGILPTCEDTILPHYSVTSLRSALFQFALEDTTTWSDARSLVPHVEALREHVEIMDRKTKLTSQFDHTFYSDIFSFCAAVLQWAMKDKEAAFFMYQEALRLKRQIYGYFNGKKSTEIAETLHHLGDLASSTDEKRAYYKEALNIYFEVFGSEAKLPLLISLLNDLAAIEIDKSKALEYYEKILELYYFIYGKDQHSLFLAETLQACGSIADDMGQYKASKMYYESALDCHYGVYGLGSDSEPLAEVFDLLGDISLKQGDFRESKRYYDSSTLMRGRMRPTQRKIDRIDREALADDCDKSDAMTVDVSTPQPFIDTTLNLSGVEEEAVELIPWHSTKDNTRLSSRGRLRLSRTLHRRGKLALAEENDRDKARGFFQKALETLPIEDANVTGEYAHLAIILSSLGCLSVELGNHEDACNHFRSAVEQQYKAFGKDAKNEAIAKTLQSLAKAAHKTGYVLEARHALERSLQCYELDEVSAETAQIVFDLGNLALELGLLSDAKSFLEQSLDMQVQLHGLEESAMIAATLSSLGSLSYGLNELNEAMQYFEDSLKMKRNLYAGGNTNDDDLAASLTNLGRICDKLGKYPRAMDLYGEACDLTTSRTEKSRIFYNLGMVSSTLSRYDEAKAFYRQSLLLKTDTFSGEGECHETATTLLNLAAIEKTQGNYAAALYYQQQAQFRSTSAAELHQHSCHHYCDVEQPKSPSSDTFVTIPPFNRKKDSEVRSPWDDASSMQDDIKSLTYWEDNIPPKRKSCWVPFIKGSKYH